MRQESAPLISIIIAVFNGKATLQQCIDSVECQTYPNKQLIIIDGGSTDGTVSLLHANTNKIGHWISEPDCGIYSAWNKGLALTRGEWICFLGADDFFWDATVLERMAVQLTNLPNKIDVAYGRIMLVSVDGQSSQSKGEPWDVIKESFKHCMCIPHVGTMHRRRLFEKNGNFDESFRIAGDYELLLRELKTGDAAFFPDVIVACQRLGGISTNTKNGLSVKREVWRAQRMHGLRPKWAAVLRGSADAYVQLILREVFGEQSLRKVLDLCRRFKRFVLLIKS
jgi:glycosyltransferase involved in cell wall biosynthesis